MESIEKIRTLIAENRTELALEQAMMTFSNTDYMNEIIILNNRLISINAHNRTNTISFEEIKVEKNSINNSLLDILSRNNNKRILESSIIEKNKNKSCLIQISVTFSLLLVVLAVYKNSSSIISFDPQAHKVNANQIYVLLFGLIIIVNMFLYYYRSKLK